MAYVDFGATTCSSASTSRGRPILPLGALGTFDEFGTYPVSVIRDGDEVRAYYGGWTRCESVPFNVAIGMAISRDGGKTFARLGNGPVLAYSPDEPFVIGGPKIRRFDGLVAVGTSPGGSGKWRRPARAGLQDPAWRPRTTGSTWTKHGKDLIESAWRRTRLRRAPTSVLRDGRYHMFFCYRCSARLSRPGESGYRIGYAWSRRPVDWMRDDAKRGHRRLGRRLGLAR